MLLHAQNLKKSYGDKRILDIKDFKIHDREKYGLVGINGSGKSTFLNILAGELLPDEGSVRVKANIAYIRQTLEIASQLKDCYGIHTKKILNQLGIKHIHSNMSGGEYAKVKFALNYYDMADLLIADEPTSNMDIKAIEIVEQMIKSFKGALLLVSHDREMLDKLCTSIVEVDNGDIKIYKGNYSDYLRQREERFSRNLLEYQEYIKEKKRLLNTVAERERSISKLKKTPTRMGNSEARLHKRSTGEIKKNLSKRVNAVKSRIQNLEVKSKPKDHDKIKISITGFKNPVAKTIAVVEHLDLSFGNKRLFDNASFIIRKGQVTALMGRNGSGKSTLARMIIEHQQPVKISPGVKIGYLSQDFRIYDVNQSILSNVMKNSVLAEGEVRTILGRLLFKTSDVYKKFGILSGGEKIKVSLAAIIASDVNFMVLDEPTNYLDIYSMEVLGKIINEYQGSTLLITHDRKLIKNTAKRILVINKSKIETFEGPYEDYLRKKNSNVEADRIRLNENMVRMRLASLANKIAGTVKDDEKQRLEREYLILARQLRDQ